MTGRLRAKLFSRLGRALVRPLQSLLETAFEQMMLDYPLATAFEIASGNDLKGDYYEFGVWQGRSFTYAYRRAVLRMKPRPFAQMKFVAFDSFEGLPEPAGELVPSHFHRGAYSAPRRLFERNCRRAEIPADKMAVVEGWFDTLPNGADLDGSKIAICYIDCDLYESAAPILDFILPRLQVGSLIVADDWNRHGASSKHGIRRAFAEWQARNPRLQLNQLALTKRILFAVDFNDRD